MQIETDKTPPDFLDGEALSYWNLHVDSLINAGILSEPEKPVFAALCQRWANWRESYKMCEDRGRDIPLKDNNGIVIGAKRAPWDVRERDQFTQYVKMCREFGLTPASRSSVSATQRPAETIDTEQIT